MSTSASRGCRQFSINEIEEATDQFDKRKFLGQGGEANVYFGEICIGSNKTPVAVKQLKNTSCEDFDKEIQILSKIQHPNLVSLIGYCDESGHKILVYEYMAEGCLSDYVKKKVSNSLSWRQRLSICLDVARGLQHLHTESDEFPKGIIHRDVKPGNILVGEGCIGKLSDFGMFKLSTAGQDKSEITTAVKGTKGYYAPEYIKFNHITRKIDVYAFGVVLFEVLCRKMPWDREDESYYLHDEDLGLWAQENVDAQIKGEITGDSLKVFTSIIGRSLQEDPWKRPKMDDVVADLYKAIEFQESENQINQHEHSTEATGVPSIKMEALRIGGAFGAAYAPDPPRYIIGLDFPLKELKALFLDNHKVGSTVTPTNRLPEVVVLSAMPGCGKTTLAQMLCHDKEIKGIYKKIFFVPVSKMANIKVIVQRIFRNTIYQLPHIVNDDDAIFQLGVLLKKLGKSPILLVLDDIWSPELESLVWKFMIEGIPRYKILVTTRFVPPAFEPTTYKLNSLKFEDAKNLFCHWAELPKPRTRHPFVSDDLLNKIVEACKGFPLALEIVGRALRGQPSYTWKDLLKKWSTGQLNVLDVSHDLLARLITILDALDEDRTLAIAKQCFLDLASFPEDQRIEAAALLDMWVELYRFDEDGTSTLANLSRLADRNFVRFEPKRNDLSDLDGCCNGKFIALHDMLRELAIHQCSQEPIQQRKRLIIQINEDKLSNEWKMWNDNEQQPHLDAQLVSILTDDSFTSNWSLCNMKFPMVKVLILNFQSNNYSLPAFVENMEQLKVLNITNYGFAAAKVSNLPLVERISTLRRIRLEHISMSSLFSSTLQLKNLKKISLIMCEIDKALNNCSQVFPNIKEIEIDCCPDLLEVSSALCDLIGLEKLSITSCNELSKLPDELGKLNKLEVLRFNSCTKLEKLPESIGNLERLNVLDISDCLNITKIPETIGELCRLNTLHMRGCSELIHEELPSSVEKLKGLTVIGDEWTTLLWKDYENVQVIVVKEEPSLHWLHKSTSFSSS